MFLLSFIFIFMLPHWIGGVFYLLVNAILKKTNLLCVLKKYNISVFVLVFSTIVPIAGQIMLRTEWNRLDKDFLGYVFMLFNAGQIYWLGFILMFVQLFAIEAEINTKPLLNFLLTFFVGVIIIAVFMMCYIFYAIFTTPWF